MVGSFYRLKKVEKEREILKIMRKNSDARGFKEDRKYCLL